MNRLRRLISVLLAAMMLFGMVSGAIAQSVWGGETEHTHAEHTHAEHMHDEHEHAEYAQDEQAEEPRTGEDPHAGEPRDDAEEPGGEYEPHYDPDMQAEFEPMAEDIPTRADNTTWSFDEETGTLTISGSGAIQNYSSNNQPWKDYKDRITSLVIEEGVEGIGNYAFYGCTAMEDVTLPEGLTTIYNYAFSGCSLITEIVLPSTLTYLGYGSFKGTAITSIVIPKSVTTMSRDSSTSAFSGAASLRTVEFEDGMTTIPNYALDYCSQVTNVIIPDSVTTIGSYAFYNCSNLTPIVLPEGLTTIDIYAFSGCSLFADITLPSTLTYLGYGSFKGTAITSIVIPKSVTTMGSSSSNSAFYGAASLRTVEFEEGMTTIPNSALRYCSQVTNVIIPNSVTTIGSYAFYNCSNLTPIVLPEGLTTIDIYAFSGCSLFADITLPSTLTCLGYGSFKGTAITSIVIPKSVTTMSHSTSPYISAFSGAASLRTVEFEDGMTTIPNYALYYCSQVTNVIIPDSVTKIGDYSFYNCSKLTCVDLPDSLTSIGGYAFSGCSGLEAIELPEGLTTIYSYAFSQCALITEITLPSTLKTINYGAFNKTAITSIVIPKSVTTMSHSTSSYISAFSGAASLRTVEFEDGMTTIPNYALDYCSQVTNVIIPDSVTIIGDYSFYNCSKLTCVDLPDSLTSIGNSAFSGCSGLEAIDLPEGLTALYSFAFSRCALITEITLPSTLKTISYGVFNGTAITSVVVPKSVTTMGSSSSNSAFYGAASLRTVEFEEGTTTIPNNALRYCSQVTNVIIPDSVTTISSYAFYNCSGLTSIDLPASITKINNYAFYGCSGLADVYFASTEEVWEAITIGSNNEPLLNAAIHLSHVHAFGDYVIESEPTCTQPGSRYRVCSTCGYTRYESIAMVPHVPGARVVDTEPTCTEYGESSCYCQTCGLRMHITSIDPLGHAFGEWVIDKPATVLEEGEMHRVCSRCAYEEQRAIDRLVIDITENSGYGTVNLTVKDSATLAAVAGASVFVNAGEEGEATFHTNGSGRLTLTLPVGQQHISVYKQGYLVRNITINVPNAVYDVPVIGLAKNDIVSGEVTVTEMTYEEIVAAGIDVSAPENSHVYQYEAVLEFEGVSVSVPYYVNTENEVINVPPVTYTPSSPSGSGVVVIPPAVGDPEPSDYYVEVIAPSGEVYTLCPVNDRFFLIFHGEVKWLKEMFDVELLVVNNSLTDTLEDCVATLELPAGLSLADMLGDEQTLTQNIPLVSEGGSESVHWYVRGDEAGSYDISVDLSGKIMPFEESFHRVYTAPKPIKVFAADALHMTFVLPDSAVEGEAYTVQVIVENVSDKPIYNISQSIFDVSQTAVSYFSNGDQTTSSISLQGSKTVFVQKFMPGDKLIIEFTVDIMFSTLLIENRLSEFRDALIGGAALYEGFTGASGVLMKLNDIEAELGAFADDGGLLETEGLSSPTLMPVISSIQSIRASIETISGYMAHGSAHRVQAYALLTGAEEYHEFMACMEQSSGTQEFITAFAGMDYCRICAFFQAAANYLGNGGDLLAMRAYMATVASFSVIPSYFVLKKAVISTMEGSTAEIPYSIVYTHVGHDIFNVVSMSSYFCSLVKRAIGEMSIKDSLAQYGLFLGDDINASMNESITAAVNDASLFAAQDSSHAVVFTAWVEYANGAPAKSGSRFTLEVEGNDTVIENNGVLTFTGDGLIKFTPHEVGLEAVLHVRMTNGGEVKEKEYSITSVPQHDCAAGHREILIPATETEAAYAALCCDVCGEIVGFDRVPFCSEHSFGEWQHTLDAACDHVGFNERTCSVCGYVEREQIAALPHSCGEWTVIAEPTCSCVGCRVSHCSACDSDVYEEIPMLPHTEGEWEYEVWPTSGEGGIRVKHCEICGAELEREEVPPLGPDYICTVSYYVDGELYATRQVLIDNMLDSAPDLPYRYMCRSWWDVDYTRTPVPHDVRVDAVFVQLEAGDTNNDGEFSFEDVTILSSYLTGAAMLNENGLYCADFNRDGDIDFSDLTALYRYFLFG